MPNGISMITLVITIIVIIILASIAIFTSSDFPDEATFAKFVSEIKNVEDGVASTRLNNARSGDSEDIINDGFSKITIYNAPDDFESFDYGSTTGYLVHLDVINYENAEYGVDYDKDETQTTYSFDVDNVYAYDATGSVFYLKGIEYHGERVYSLENANEAGLSSTDDGPIITNITVTSGELEDGTPTKAKAKIIISAFPRNGGELNVLVRSTLAEKQADGTYVAQVSRNGVYTVLVTEEGGGRTIEKVTVSDIIESTVPPTNLSIIINDGAAYVSGEHANVKLRADGAKYMMINKNNPLKPSATDSGWQDYEQEIIYDMGDIEGIITLYAWFMDEYSNVTSTIVKATVTYDKTPPTSDAPTVTITGAFVVVNSNQYDRISPNSYIAATTKYGYKIEGTEDYTWSVDKLIGPLESKKIYEFVTFATDEAGNESVSNYIRMQMEYDYTITFDLQEGVDPDDFPIMHASGGNSITIPNIEPSKEGYDFLGWAENSEETDLSNMYAAGSEYTPTGNIVTKTLYAIWAPRTDMPYKVYHYTEKLGMPNEYELRLLENCTGTTGQDVFVLPKTSGEFKGFTENTEHDDRLVMTELLGDGSTELRIYYKRKNFTLSFIAENGRTLDTMYEVPYESEIQLSIIPNNGYEFDKWSIQGSVDTAPFLDGANVANTRFKMLPEDTTLVASCIVEKYTITYNLNGGIVDVSNPTEYTKETPKFTLNNPYKIGYDFVGWTGTDLLTPTITVEIDPPSMENIVDREYTAIYTPGEDLLTIETSSSGLVNTGIIASIKCLDDTLIVEYKIGNDGWSRYTSPIFIEENTVLHARALQGSIVISEKSLIISNIDKEKPVIEGITSSDDWVPGEILKLHIIATDNVDILGYAISKSKTQPAVEDFTEEDVTILGNGTNYLWVMDLTGNTQSISIYVWDISKNNDQKVYAILDEKDKLLLVGEGETASYTESGVPYKSYLSNIKSVEISKGITIIGDYILANMENVGTIQIADTVQDFTEDALIYSNGCDEIKLESTNNNFVFENGTLFNRDKTKIYLHMQRDTNQIYAIPDTVNKINKLAFYNNDNLRKIIVTTNPELGEGVFKDCSSLVSIEGEVGNTKIEKETFSNCTKLEIITLSNTLEEISYQAFNNTYNLSTLVIPKGVTTISPSNGVYEVFKNIGINALNGYGQGIVKYYQSCLKMSEYATNYSSEAHFEVIDDIGPSLVAIKIQNIVSGMYPIGTQIEFVAEFDERIKEEITTPPTLTIKIGNGTDIVITDGTFDGNKIIYKYIIEAGSEGQITLVNYIGTVYDEMDNKSDIYETSMEGEDITIYTAVTLEENNVVKYFSTLQDAIDEATINPETKSKITLLKNIQEDVDVASGKWIEVNFNNNEILGKGNYDNVVYNRGVLEFVGPGEISTIKNGIENNDSGMLKMTDITLTVGSSYNGIINNAACNLFITNSNITSQEGTAIINDGIGVINNSVIASNSGSALQMDLVSITNIVNGEISSSGVPATIEVSDIVTNLYLNNTNITATNGSAINNTGNITIRGNTNIEAKSTAIINDGKINMENGNVITTVQASEIIKNNVNADFKMFSGELTSSTNTIINNSGAVTIEGGKILSRAPENFAIVNNIDAFLYLNGGTFEAIDNLQGIIKNEGITNIGEDASLRYVLNTAQIEITSQPYAIYNLSNAGLEIVGANISVERNSTISSAANGKVWAIAIHNLGQANILDADIYVKDATAIHNKNICDIENVKIESDIPNWQGKENACNNRGGIMYIISADITSTTGRGAGLYNVDGTVDIDKINISGFSTGIDSYSESIQAEVNLGVDDGFIEDEAIDIDAIRWGLAIRSNAEDSIGNFNDGSITGITAIRESGDNSIINIPESTYIKKTVSGTMETATIEQDIGAPKNVTLTASTYEWTNSAVTLTGSAEDEGSGIVAYAFTSSADTPAVGEWINLPSPQSTITMTKDYTERKNVYFHVKDQVGNEAVSNMVDIRYDNVPPTITSITKNVETWTSGEVLLTVVGRDNESGIAGYQVTDTYHDVPGAESNYTMVASNNDFTYTISLGNGTWYVYLRDLAGNASYGQVNITNVDRNEPTINIEVVDSQEGLLKILVQATDDESGVSSIRINGEEQTLVDSTTIENTKEAEYNITVVEELVVIATDGVGNETTNMFKTYGINYHENGGIGERKHQIKLENKDISLLDNMFTRDGFEFTSWNTNSDGSGITYNHGDVYSENENITLYAIWNDIGAPQIIDVNISDTWDASANENLIIDILAKDNVGVTEYAVTSTNTQPTSWSTSGIVSVPNVNGVWYVWAKDASGNISSSMEIAVYNISQNASDKSVFVLIKPNSDGTNTKTLILDGTGETKDFTGNVTDIPWNSYISDITKVDIKGETIIGDYVLSELQNANEIIIRQEVVGADINAFVKTNNYSGIYIEGYEFSVIDGILYSADGTKLYMANRENSAAEVIISIGTTEIGEYAFYENESIEKITIEGSVNIPEGCFSNASELQQIECPNGIGDTSIGAGAFENCYKLTGIVISEAVTTLGANIGIFENIGINAGTSTGKGVVYYYASCDAMVEYVVANPDEATFIVLDNLPPTTTSPTLAASSATIAVTSNQVDNGGYITQYEYNISKVSGTYEESNWQTEAYFIGLDAETTYYVITRATDNSNNLSVSEESSITTQKVPDTIDITATPTMPTKENVTVTIEWPIVDMEELYGAGWPDATTVAQQVGIKGQGDTNITWEDVGDGTIDSTVKTISENNTTIYARLYDGKNYTAQTISLTITNIDKIKPTGSVTINNGALTTISQEVKLNLTSTDDRNVDPYGVKYYYASENPTTPTDSTSTTAWEVYNGNGDYDFTLSNTRETKTVYVWFMDAAYNVSDAYSAQIEMLANAVKLDENGEETRYYDSLAEAISAARADSPALASQITLLKDITSEGTQTIGVGNNIILDMAGYNIMALPNSEQGNIGIMNRGKLQIINTDTANTSTMEVTSSGTATRYGVYNDGGLVMIRDVTIIADYGVYNKRPGI